MADIKSSHTFHIPVMGLAYTIDTPIRVAALGISSALSIVDDELIEKMRAFYSKKLHHDYIEISRKAFDYRAKRITAYLNLTDTIIKQKFEQLKTELSENREALENYLALLPNTSEIAKGFASLKEQGLLIKENLRDYIETKLSPGSIDVNIMTKVDKENFDENNEPLPVTFNDAHAALRGFANSRLTSSVILSAGMNPRLYSYFEQFPDFFPDAAGNFNKKIILKVSDFRSASIQANFFAKKGLWVSEYRIESGLNCGGHAFATEGLLLGPILDEFLQKKEALAQNAFALMAKALAQKGFTVPEKAPGLKITVQGGVGTAQEHEFLLKHYKADSVGWGSPFLLVPQATATDPVTRQLLADAREEDLYMSHISPLGIPFNTVKGTTNELLKQQRIRDGRYGSSCPKKYLALNTEFGGQPLCTASRKYQEHKMHGTALQGSRQEITEKSCLCVGLTNPAYLEKGIPLKGEAQGVVVCPGPNMAYFTEEVTLARMVRHIYGNDNVITVTNRPHFFIKELSLYITHLEKEAAMPAHEALPAQIKKLEAFRDNLLSGIAYYRELFYGGTAFFSEDRVTLQKQLLEYKARLQLLAIGSSKPKENAYICTKQCDTCQCASKTFTL